MYGSESCTFLKEKKIIKENEPTWFSVFSSLSFLNVLFVWSTCD